MIYRKVKTIDGIGEIVSITTESNGLYVSYERAQCVVWYGTCNAQNGKVSWTYNMSDILRMNPELERELKINKILHDKG